VAPGQDEVLVVMIDRRGRIASTILSVDDDDRFEEDDVPLVTPAGEELSEGPIVATVFGVGRDGVVGDGEIAGVTRADLEALDEETRERVRAGLANRSVTRTQQQVLELFYEESVGEAGSDDLVLADAFRYTDGRTNIESVHPAGRANATGTLPVTAGETVVVRGVTNRKPDDNTITVEAVDGPTPDAISIASTDEWGLDGVWTVTLDTDGAEPGTYTVEADDGDDTDRVTVEVVSADDGTATNSTGGANRIARTDR
jgi:major cell surface glycoprotein (TIGR04216 family)